MMRSTLPLRTVLAVAVSGALGACSIPDVVDRSGSSRPETQAPAISTDPQTRACLAELGAMGTRFTPLPDRYLGPGCSQVGTVRLQDLAGDGGPLGVANLGPVRCEVARTFAAWARFGVDRAARQILGSPLARIETYGSYSCRNIAGSNRRSSHATSEAIDVAAFVLADGRRISLIDGWNGSPQEREFLRTIMASACRRFDTVLGPQYNAAHRDHFHLEGVIDGESFCR